MSRGGEGGGLNTVGSSSSSSRPMRDYGATSSGPNVLEINFAGFSPTEFISLKENIGTSIQSVQQGRQFLEKAQKVIGTVKDNQANRDKMFVKFVFKYF